MMETKEIIGQNNQQIDRTTVSAEHDFRILSDVPSPLSSTSEPEDAIF